MTNQVILDILKEVYYTIVVHLVKTLYDFQQIDSFFFQIFVFAGLYLQNHYNLRNVIHLIQKL